ncbi:MAG: hypothetical protein ABFD58_05690 [Anaerolineaceae bacterium]
MIKKRSFWISLLILAPFLLLLIFNRTILNEYFIDPITKLVWLLISILRSVDQNIYWVLLVITAAIIVPLLLPEHTDRHAHTAYQEYPLLDDRLSYWKKLYKSAEGNLDDRKKLQRALCEIRKSVNEIKGCGSNEDIPVLDIPFPNSPRKIQKLLSFVNPVRKKSKGKYEMCINEILETLETDLEIKHD